MCLTIKGAEHKRVAGRYIALKARIPINIYKWVKKDYSAVHQTYKYEKGQLYVIPGFTESDVRNGQINQGFHGYVDRKSARLGKNYRGGMIIKCIIPKNSLYFYGANGEIVSDQLQIP